MPDGAFNLLATPIQHVLWDMRWEQLRPIQCDAIREILGSEHDIIISAHTAAGKTEAAFLPILSKLFQQPPASVGAMYIGPLKALINDQFRRVEDLCQRAEIPVHRWHGDVDAGKKARLLEQPGGVLLITPESLESMFINRASAMGRLFSDLRFVVIDEVHSLVGRERGLQLRSQLFRLRRYIRRQFRSIALSATIGDAVDQYKTWLSPEMPQNVTLIQDPGEHKQVLFGIQAFLADKPSNDTTPLSSMHDDEADDFPSDLVNNTLKAFCGRKNLIFCNSRSDVEGLADSLNDSLRRTGRPEEFLVHHGSLSKEIRERVEEEMRGARPATVVCTSSLELGIDIGNLTAIGQVGPTWSVSSLRQRLGRSGRHEGEPQCMRVMLPLHKTGTEDDLADQLYPDLLQAVAAAELMRSGWVEPPNLAEMDLSTLVQQILSVLAETGGTTADTLGRLLLSQGAFRNLPTSTFVAVLRSLGRRRLIEQAAQGYLLLSPDGEQLVHDYEFYSAFTSAVEFAVRNDGRNIGTLPALFIPAVGDHLLLAARRWQIQSVDMERKEILVNPAIGRKKPRFHGGSGEIHSRVRQQMRDVVLNQTHCDYLGGAAAELLAAARRVAAHLRLQQQQLVATGDISCVWFTWTGTKIHRTLGCLVKHAGIDATDKGIALVLAVSQTDVLARLRAAREKPISALQLARQMPAPEVRKFDRFLDKDLLYEAFAADYLDMEGAIASIDQLLESYGNGGPLQDATVVAPSETSEQLDSAEPECPIVRIVAPQLIDIDDYAAVPAAPNRCDSSDNCRLADCEFVAFDLETTGLRPTFASIVEIGAVRFRADGSELGRFQQLVDPRCPIPSAATAVHRITAEMLSGAPTIDQVLPRFLRFVGDRKTILIAHNAWFDRSFLAVAMSQARCLATGHRIADTLALSRALLPAMSDHRLESLARQLRVPLGGCHRAVEDSLLVQGVFLALLASSTLSNLAELFELAAAGWLEPVTIDASEMPQGFEELGLAIQTGRAIFIAYRGGTKGDSIRRIRPVALVRSGNRDYLSAICDIDKIKKTYRLDRITSFRLESETEANC